MRGRIMAVAFLAILLFGAVGAVQQGYDEAVRSTGNFTEYDNETFDSTGGQLDTLDESNRDVLYSEEEDVEVWNQSTANGTNATLVLRAGNYTWYDHNGTVLTKANSYLANVSNTNSTITYGTYEPKNEQRLARDLTILPASMGDAILLIGILAVLMAAVAIFARAGA